MSQSKPNLRHRLDTSADPQVQPRYRPWLTSAGKMRLLHWSCWIGALSLIVLAFSLALAKAGSLREITLPSEAPGRLIGHA
jgi:hypothetical protein